MNHTTYPMRRMALLLAALVLIMATTACVARRSGVSWAALTLVGEENYILVSYNDFMVLVDPANGAPVPLRDSDGNIRTNAEGALRHWEISGSDSKSKFYTSPLWLDDELLLVLDYQERLLIVSYPNACLANHNGACVDNYTQSEVPGQGIADMVVGDDRVFIALSERDLVALDLNTLDQEWLFETERGLWAEPVVVDGMVYFAGMDHHMYAVDAETGAEIWRLDLGSAIAAAPFYYAGNDEAEDEQDPAPRFYVGTFGRKVFEISLAGEVAAEYSTENWVWSTPVLFGGTLYVADISGFVYALDIRSDLAEIWKINTESVGIRPSPLVTPEHVIVASRDGQVFWLNRETGEIRFRQEVNAEILSEILLVERADETLVVVSTVKNDRTLVAFTLDGVPRWTYQR